MADDQRAADMVARIARAMAAGPQFLDAKWYGKEIERILDCRIGPGVTLRE